jgi:hypothetical protein
VEDSSAAGADPEAREAFVACPFSKASLNRLASVVSVFLFISILTLGGRNGNRDEDSILATRCYAAHS